MCVLIQQRDHDVVALGHRLFPYDHQVPFADVRVDHAVSGDLQREAAARADGAAVDANPVGSVLLSQDGIVNLNR